MNDSYEFRPDTCDAVEPVDSEKRDQKFKSLPVSLGNIPHFLWNSLLQHYYTELNYTCFATLTNFYRNAEQAVYDLMIGKLIEEYYPESVYQFHGVDSDVSNITYYNISGTTFCVPVKYIKGLFACIEVEDKLDSNTMTRHYRVVFVGRKHDVFARKFNDKICELSRKSIYSCGFRPSKYVYYMTTIRGNGRDDESRVMTGRKISSVFLKKQMASDILETLQKFRDPATKEFYQSIGEVYHYNMLLHGKPGTGKNSLVAALATELEIGVVRIDPSFFTTYTERGLPLLDISRNGLGGRIFLIDEIDMYTYNRDKREGKKDERIILPMILDFLDNVGDGSIVIMTTNHLEHLDPALIRSGRVNREVQFEYWERPVFLQALKSFNISEEEFHTFASVRNIRYTSEDILETGSITTYIPATVIDICRQFNLNRFWSTPESKRV